MQVGEAMVVGTSETPDGAQELELNAVCPAADFERLDVVVGPCRVAVPLNRPGRGVTHTFKVTLQTGGRLKPGDKAFVEFFYPGEQARAHCADRSPIRLEFRPMG